MLPFILHNGEIHPASDPVMTAGQTGLLSGWGVFSTLRVTRGVLFEWPRHWARMAKDAALTHVAMPPDPDAVHADLLRLVDANALPDATLRVCIVRNGGGHAFTSPTGARGSDVYAMMAPLKQWGDSVKLTWVPNARHGGHVFAGAKVTAWGMNLTWLEDAQQRGFDECLLLNQNGEVSECTSANIFAVEGNQVWTPPVGSSGCLPGVTRDLLINAIRVPDYPVAERVLTPGQVENADEVFITSTTRDVLTVESIDGTKIRNQGGARAALRGAFREYLRKYAEEDSPKSAAISGSAQRRPEGRM